MLLAPITLKIHCKINCNIACKSTYKEFIPSKFLGIFKIIVPFVPRGNRIISHYIRWLFNIFGKTYFLEQSMEGLNEIFETVFSRFETHCSFDSSFVHGKSMMD